MTVRTTRNSSRELSERVEIDFQKRPNRFRQRVWWSAFGLGMACLAWLGYAGARGNHLIYEGGSLSHAHRLFENDCARCHTTWAPVERALQVDFTDRVYSVPNEACLSCHPGSEHHRNQIPAHTEISCAHCHIEHQGERELKRTADRVCLECHAELKSHTAGEGSFADALSTFGSRDGHPEFAIQRLLNSDREQTAGIGDRHGVLQRLEFQAGTGWRDRARIRFNHAAHLQTVPGENGRPVFRMAVRGPQLEGGSEATGSVSGTAVCRVCHQTDTTGRYMLPIQFEQHCRSCHPLLFDNQRYPGEQVPHQTPEVVRGFLTEKYTLAALNAPGATGGGQPARPIPGRAARPPLSKDQTEWLAEQLRAAESESLAHTHVLFGAEAKGGCAYCHLDEAGNTPDTWTRITPPRIPDRWQPHAVFSHQSHQLMSCTECHEGAAESRSTGDVLLPGVDLCRKCHSPDPAQPGQDSPARLQGAGTDCVECHLYHDHGKDNFTGQMNSLLRLSEANRDATSPAESSM